MKFKSFSTFLIAVTLMGAGNAIEPYDSIHILPFDGQGWFEIADDMDKCLKKKPMTVIEVGSWLGYSSRFIAERLPQGGKLYCVDTWLGTTSEDLHQKDPRLPYLYQQFLSNVVHTGFTEIIVPIRMKSLEAAKALNVQADLIFLDGAHDEQSVFDDITAWLPHLKTNGVICGDDWTWPSVQKAVDKAAKKYGFKVYAKGNFWKLIPLEKTKERQA